MSFCEEVILLYFDIQNIEYPLEGGICAFNSVQIFYIRLEKRDKTIKINKFHSLIITDFAIFWHLLIL